MQPKSQVQLSNLHNLIRNAEHPLIQNFTQLCEELFGRKRCTWLLFEKLMRWMQYSVRSDGSVYKSAQELAEEVRCSEKTVDRAIPALEDAGLDMYIKKANGAPTRHFRVNVKRLIERLAAIFGRTLEDICAMMEIDSDIFKQKNSNTGPDQSAPDVPKNPGQMSESVTRTTHRKNSSLNRQGFSSFLQKMEAKKWCSELDTKPEPIETWVRTYGFDMVQSTIMQARRKRDEGKINKSMFGWVRATLQAKHKAEIHGW